jgi:hypothetical protein
MPHILALLLMSIVVLGRGAALFRWSPG